MTKRFLIGSAYVAAILALCFYVALALIWIGTTIIYTANDRPIYKSLATPIDDCRDFKCVTIVEKDRP